MNYFELFLVVRMMFRNSIVVKRWYIMWARSVDDAPLVWQERPRNTEHFNALLFSCDAHNSQVTKLRSPNEGHWLNFGAQSQTWWISFQITLFGSTSSVTLIWRIRWCYLKSWKLLISPPLHENAHISLFYHIWSHQCLRLLILLHPNVPKFHVQRRKSMWHWEKFVI